MTGMKLLGLESTHRSPFVRRWLGFSPILTMGIGNGRRFAVNTHYGLIETAVGKMLTDGLSSGMLAVDQLFEQVHGRCAEQTNQ